MEMHDLTFLEQQAIRNALLYWESAWDWECPLLFGLELEEFRILSHEWPKLLPENEEHMALAVSSALRELLYGASAVSKDKVLDICGIPFEQVEDICGRLQPYFRQVLG